MTDQPKWLPLYDPQTERQMGRWYETPVIAVYVPLDWPTPDGPPTWPEPREP